MERHTILITADLSDEPNETIMTVIEIDQNLCRFHGFSGFEAYDIYNLITKKETKEDEN